MKGRAFRFRIALFFAAQAVGAIALILLGLWKGFDHAGGDPNGYALAGMIAGFGTLGLSALVWMLFDRHVARPIDRLAADLRTRAHADVTCDLDAAGTAFLGDLGPAAQALSARLGEETVSAAVRIAAETARLTAERETLSSVLSEIPMAVILVAEDHRILLYDGQAAQTLEPVRPLCLGQTIFGYLDGGQISRALDGLPPQGAAAVPLSTADGTRVFDATLRRLGEGAGYMLMLPCHPDTRAERPIAYDIAATARALPSATREARLDSLAYVIFDTETTGLLPDKDEVVQIGAVRAMGARLVPGEVFDTLVNPGRPIPQTSTLVHGISDDMVANAPRMDVAGARFLHFAEDAVLVAHNAPFDMAFLRRHAQRTGQRLDHPVLDTVLLGAALFGASDSLTLDTIAGRLGVTIPDVVRHTAIGDAQATAAVFLKMVNVFSARGAATLGDLIDIQKAHARLLPDLNGER